MNKKWPTFIATGSILRCKTIKSQKNNMDFNRKITSKFTEIKPEIYISGFCSSFIKSVHQILIPKLDFVIYLVHTNKPYSFGIFKIPFSFLLSKTFFIVSCSILLIFVIFCNE